MVMKKIFLILLAGLVTMPAFSQVYSGQAATKTPEQKLNDEYCSGIFHSSEGKILDVASSTSVLSYINILDWLQGRVAGLQVYTSRTGTSIPVMRGGVPAIYIDELPVSAGQLNMISVNDIAIVKVIRGPFFGGFNSSYGAIAIYTFGGEEEEEEDAD